MSGARREPAGDNRTALLSRAVVVAVMLTFPVSADGPIRGAGAAFPQALYLEWGRASEARGGRKISCESAELPAVFGQIAAGGLEFAALDRPLSIPELTAKGLVQFPTAIGGVVPIANVPGVVPGAIRLNGSVLAEIFLGRIGSWSDPRLVALNPGLSLPETPIKVVHPIDSSGATLVFTTYLSLQSSEWRSGAGAGATVVWPIGEARRDLKAAVAFVQSTPGALGYVDYAYAADHGVPKLKLQNRAGEYVAPNVVSFQSAAANAPWTSTPGFALTLVDQPSPGAWPMTAPTFAALSLQPRDPARTLDVLRFFSWAMRSASTVTTDSGYVPLPPAVVDLVESAWRRQVKRANGTPVWPPEP